MIRSLDFKIFVIALLGFASVGCLKTRSQVEQQDQTKVQGSKQAQNQNEAQNAANVPEEKPPIDEKELLRQTMGKVEVLEAEIAQLKTSQAAQAQNGSVDPEKFRLMQEVVVRLEAKMAAMDAEKQAQIAQAQAKVAAADEAAKQSKFTAFQIAEAHFKNKEWKKAILSYQKYSEEMPKGKFVSDAKYKIGVSFQELGLKDEAVAFYEEVIAQFPNSENGKKARYRLSQIKKK